MFTLHIQQLALSNQIRFATAISAYALVSWCWALRYKEALPSAAVRIVLS